MCLLGVLYEVSEDEWQRHTVVEFCFVWPCDQPFWCADERIQLLKAATWPVELSMVRPGRWRCQSDGNSGSGTICGMRSKINPASDCSSMGTVAEMKQWLKVTHKRVARGTRAVTKRPASWNLRFYTCVGALKAAAHAVPRSVTAVRLLTGDVKLLSCT